MSWLRFTERDGGAVLIPADRIAMVVDVPKDYPHQQDLVLLKLRNPEAELYVQAAMSDIAPSLEGL